MSACNVISVAEAATRQKLQKAILKNTKNHMRCRFAFGWCLTLSASFPAITALLNCYQCLVCVPCAGFTRHSDEVKGQKRSAGGKGAMPKHTHACTYVLTHSCMHAHAHWNAFLFMDISKLLAQILNMFQTEEIVKELSPKIILMKELLLKDETLRDNLFSVLYT